MVSLVILSAAVGRAQEAAPPPAALPALTVRGENFVDAAGQPVRFWGVNLVSVYTDRARADGLATKLAERQINLARPHHLLRASRDWAPDLASGALVLYNKDTSREFDPVALDRFDYLNAALKRQGIYLALSVHFTRRFLPGDADIITTDAADRRAWREAIDEMNTEPDWRKYFDVWKVLPVVDERAALLSEEFIRNLLAHVNPYTGVAYGADSQLLTLELLNESSFEYAIVCNNKFPEYFQNKLLAKWREFAGAAGIEAGNLYHPADARAVAVRARFLRQLDADYFARVKAVVRAAGCPVPMTASNLWRGENNAAMHAETADFIENHMYMNPLVVKQPADGFVELLKTTLAGKPFFIGEFNQAEGEKNIKAQAPFRTMLMPAVAAYGSFYNWTGVEWFAWLHGDQELGKDGAAATDRRAASIGQMIADSQMLDHLRTAGLMFRQRLVAPSAAPVTLSVADPLPASNYQELMRGQFQFQPGWHEIHAIRKQFVPPFPADAAPHQDAPWMTQSAPNPIVSDTGEIIKDTARQQLTVSAPQAEAFSGYLDERAPAGLKHLTIGGARFATVLLVARDGQPLTDSERLLISRTGLDVESQELATFTVNLTGLKQPADGRQWQFTPTRPAAAPARPLTLAPDGTLALPAEGWYEAELELKGFIP